jgi:hypothetical protein
MYIVFGRYVQAFLSSQLVGKTGSYWIGLSQDMSSGAIESWANGFPVLFTHWAKSHTGNSLYSNKMIFVLINCCFSFNILITLCSPFTSDRTPLEVISR